MTSVGPDRTANTHILYCLFSELLVEAGGNAEVADIFGYTPLQIATSDYWDNTEFAKVFTQENN